MLKALVPIDGSEHALPAVRHIIRLVREHEPVDIHLLNVQPPFHGDVTAFVSKDSVHEYQREQGQKALGPACALLDEAGIPYTRHIYIGHPAEMIAACAKELRCDTVIVGTHGYRALAQLLHGSITQDLIHQMDPHIAVTLVKDNGSHAQAARRGAAA
jgi:nucleotide-binding universal stress UspA family protein